MSNRVATSATANGIPKNAKVRGRRGAGGFVVQRRQGALVVVQRRVELDLTLEDVGVWDLGTAAGSR